MCGGVCMGVCAWERGDSEQPWHWGGHSWVLLVLLPRSFLLPMLQDLGAVLQGVYTVLWGGVESYSLECIPRVAAHDSPAWALGRHCVKSLVGYCLAGELSHILTVVQAGLGMTGCTLPW